jgi:hypothetical protein
MARKHAVLISLAVACALVAGVFAAVRTTELGASASSGTGLSDRQLTTRDRELNRISKRIRAHARKRPPALPELRVPGSSGSGSSGFSSSGGGSISSGPGPGPQVLVSNAGPGSILSGHHDDFDDHGRDDERADVLEDRADDREDRMDDAADAAKDRADALADAREDAADHD